MLIITLCLISELCHTTGFIDIPTVPQYDIPNMLGGGITFSMPLRSDDDPDADPMDFTMVFRYGFRGKGELSLAMYTPSTYALSFAYLLKEEKGNAPAFFCGIDDISYNTYLSTIGMEGTAGFIEEKNYYLKSAGRPWELFSAYIAMQKTIAPVFNIVFGIGRGRFVGYGKRSHIFNTDLFIIGEDYADPAQSISAWAFGIFFGGSIKFPFGLEMIAEIDGRDGNAGLKYHHKYFTITTALTKCEHFWSPRPFSPRFTFALETSNRFMLEGPAVGSIECIVRDNTTKQMLQDPIVDIKELNKRYKAKGGTFTMSLPAGTYTLTITKANYEDYMAKITVASKSKSELVFNLKKTQQALAKEKALLEKEKNINAYMSQGKIYYAEGNLSEAINSFEMIMGLDPDHQEAKDYLAKIEPKRKELIAIYTAEARSKTQTKDYTKAMEYWNKVLALDATNAEAKAGITNLQQKIAALKQPVKPKQPTKPKEPVATKGQIEALYTKGVSQYISENYDAALKAFNQVLALDPNHTGAKDYKKRTEARIKVLKGGG